MKRALLLLPLMAASINAFAEEPGNAIEQRGTESGFRVCELGRCVEPTVKVMDVQPPPAPPSVPQVVTTLPEPVVIQYGLGSARLSHGALRELGTFALNSAAHSIEVVGHTDRLGNVRLNKRLAKARASAVAKALIKFGVTPSRIRISSECCIDFPPTANPPARRAEVRIVNMKDQIHGE